MSKILLIRHGQASFGAEEYDCLSPLGERQAQHLGTFLAEINCQVDQVISGNMKRHKQTRDGVLSGMSLAPNPASEHQIDKAWNEFDFRQVLARFNPDFQDHDKLTQHLKSQANPEAEFIRVFAKAIDHWIQGTSNNALQSEAQHQSTQHQSTQENWESWESFQARVLQGLSRAVAATPKGKNTVIFTSGGAITVVILSLLNIPLKHFLNINKELVNCGVTQLRVGKKGATLLTMNEHNAMEQASQQYQENFVSFK